jgi:hypothetical protein
MYYTNSVHGGCQGPPTLFGGVTAQQPSLTDRASRLCHRIRATDFYFCRGHFPPSGIHTARPTIPSPTPSLVPRRWGLSDGLTKDPRHLLRPLAHTMNVPTAISDQRRRSLLLWPTTLTPPTLTNIVTDVMPIWVLSPPTCTRMRQHRQVSQHSDGSSRRCSDVRLFTTP